MRMIYAKPTSRWEQDWGAREYRRHRPMWPWEAAAFADGVIELSVVVPDGLAFYRVSDNLHELEVADFTVPAYG